VTNPVRGTNNRTLVTVLGTGQLAVPRIGSTRVTVDGGNILIVGTLGSAPSAGATISNGTSSRAPFSLTGISQ